MSGGVYGGDEVGALVFDPGHASLRIGYAGEDSPKSEIPAVVGVSTKEGETEKTYHVDTVALNFAKPGMEMTTYMKDGMIDDWDTFERVVDHAYKKVRRPMQCQP